MMKVSAADTFNEMKRSCIDCHTTRTPLWRGGPTGPRSLCNACGIRYRKTKKLALLGRDKGRAQKRKRKFSGSNNNNNNNHHHHHHHHHHNNKGATKRGISLKAGLMAVGSDMGEEEEEAAILLMSLSYGCLCA